MAEILSKPPSPYVGPRPFTREDQALFFGRAEEIEKLSALVSAYSTVLLFSQSGAGKSSLINAGLIPLLEARAEFQILPPARVGVKILAQPDETIDNIYTFNLLSHWDSGATEPERLARLTLPEYLRSLPRPLDEFEVPANRLVIIDQFEELFTTFPEHWEQRAVFFEQVRRALTEDPQLSILFAIREDYIAELVPFEATLPGRLGMRLRLERLRRDSALMAVTKPLGVTDVTFALGVAEKLVDDLMSVQVETGVGTVKSIIGEFVEPVVLQVVCDNLWNSLPKGTTIIEQQHVEQYAQVTGALMGYYDACLEDTIRKTASADLDAGKLRRWFGETLITPVGTRGTIYQGKTNTGDLANTDVALLEKWHIIRGEQRANARWYELSHDRFIQPILRSNEAWRLEQERLRAESEKARAEKVERKYTGAPINARVYLSYSRQDIDVARRLVADLSAAQVDVWVDWEDIPVGAAWQQEILRGIDSADAFIVLVSQNALTSQVVNNEMDYARQVNKRIIPILVGDVDEDNLRVSAGGRSLDMQADLTDEAAGLRSWNLLRRMNFIMMRLHDDYQHGLRTLMTALATDLDYVKTHTRLLVRAVEWEQRGHNASLLIRGQDLLGAERWLASAGAKEPKPTESQTAYILASRQHENQQQRTILRGVLIALVVMFALAILSFALFRQSESNLSLANVRGTDVAFQAATATFEQGRAENNAATAVAAQGTSDANAATATIAQGQAELNAAAAVAAQGTSDFNAAIARTQAAIALAAEATSVRESVLARSLALAGDSQQALTNGIPDLALAFALEANAVPAPPTEARRALVRALSRSWIVSRYTGHADQVVSAAVSPDGKTVAGGGRDGSLIVWDAQSGAAVHDIDTGLTDLNGSDYSPDGRYLLIGGCAERTDTGCSLGSTALWDAAEGTRVWELSVFPGFVNDAAFSPDGSIASVVVESGDLALIDAVTGELIRSLPLEADSLTSLAFSPDGTRIAVGAQSGAIYLVTAETGESGVRLEQRGRVVPVTSLVFTQDSAQVIVGMADGLVVIWDVAARQPVLEEFTQPSQINGVAVSPDGRSLLTASADGTVAMRNVQTFALLRTFVGHGGAVWDVSFSPDGLTAVSASSDGTVIRWDALQDDHTLFTANSLINSAAVSPSGESIAVGLQEGRALLIDPRTGETIHEFIGHTDSVSSVAFSPDGTQIITGSADGTARLWDAATGDELRVLAGHTAGVTSAAFSSDGQWIVTGSADGTARLWDAATGDELRVLAGHTAGVTSAAFSLDARWIVTSSADGAARLWDLARGEALRVLAGHTAGVTSADFSPDGAWIVTGSEDGAARLWDVSTGALIRQFDALASVLTVSFSPDGRRIVTGDNSRSLLLWDVDTGETLRQYLGSSDWVRSAVFMPDGRGIVSASDVALTLWRVEDYGGDLSAWAYAFRHVPTLTCAELGKYHTECRTAPLPTRTPYPTLLPTTTFTPTLTPSATLTFTASPTSTATPTPATPVAQAERNLALRSGPGAQYPVVAALAAGASLDLVGISEDGSWFQVRLADGSLAWLAIRAVAASGNLESIPTALAPTFTFTPSDTPTPTATLTPSDTPTTTPTATVTPTMTRTATSTPSATLDLETEVIGRLTQTAAAWTSTPTLDLQATVSALVNATLTAAVTPTLTPTPSNTPTQTLTPTNTPTLAPDVAIRAVTPDFTHLAAVVEFTITNPAAVEFVRLSLIDSGKAGELAVLELPPSTTLIGLPVAGLQAGDYRIRLELVDFSGQIIAHAEQRFAFNPPTPVLAAGNALAGLNISTISGEMRATDLLTTIDLTGRDNVSQLQNLQGQYADFVFGTTIGWGPGALDDQCGVAFRRLNDNYDAVTISREGRLYFTAQLSGQVIASAQGNGAWVNTGRSESNTLWMVASGETFTVYLNGRLAAQFTDSSRARGGIALLARTFVSSDQSNCTFTDTWIYEFLEEEAPVLASPTPTPSFTPSPTRTASPTFTPSPTPTPGGETPTVETCKIVVQGNSGLNLRAAPDSNAALIARLDFNSRADVLDIIQPEGSIYRWVRVNSTRGVGWLREDFVGFIGDCAAFGEYPRYPAPIEQGWWVRGYNDGGDPAASLHYGWSLGAVTGEPVFAGPHGGEVVAVYPCAKCTPDRPSTTSQGIPLGDASVFSDPGWVFGYGNMVIVRYPHDLLPDVTRTQLEERGAADADIVCTYAHLNSIDVEAGSLPDRRMQIGTVGGTGATAAPELALECRTLPAGESFQVWAEMRGGLLDPIILFERLMAPSLVAHITPPQGATFVNVRTEPRSGADNVMFRAETGVRNVPVLDVQPDANGDSTDGKLHQWFLLRFSSGSGWVRDDLISIQGDGSPFGYPDLLEETPAFSLLRGETAAAAAAYPTITIENAPQIRVLREFAEHTEDVWHLEFSPDGALLASGSDDNKVIVWDMATGNQRAAFAGAGDMTDVIFSPDGSLLAAADFGGVVAIYDLATHERRVLADYPVPVRDLDFSPDGSLLAVGDDNSSISVWNVATGTEVLTLTGHTKGMNSVDFSPDGTRLVSASDDLTLRLWSIPDGALIAVMEGHTRDNALRAAFSPDGSLIASASWDRFLRLWDGETGELIAAVRHDYGVNAFAFSPDGSRIAVGTLNLSNNLYIRSTATGETVTELVGHTGDITDVEFSPDGTLLASISYDHTLRVWDAAAGAQLVRVTDSRGENALTVEFNPNQTLVAAGIVDGRVRLHGIRTESIDCVITAMTSVNIRVGPSAAFEAVGVLRSDETRTAIGRGSSPEGGQWWQIGASEWVFADATRSEGDCEALPDNTP